MMANKTEKLQRLAGRAVVPTLLWWLLAGGVPASWPFGLVVVGAAVAVGGLVGAPSLSLPFLFRFLRFLPFFLLLSLRGGIDVARRALSPSLPLAPACLVYPLRLAAEGSRVFFANCISLLPGTLSVDLGAEQILVHTLDAERPVRQELAVLEGRIARLFGLDSPRQGAGND
ncbi:Na+/H+ antiporter subunit E [Thiovibrio sp. JS02]